MGQDTFLMYLPAVLGLSFVGFIALGVAAVQDGKHVASKSDIVRRGYIYLVSFVTLLLIALSVANLLDISARATVLTKADPVQGAYDEMPPSVFLLTTKVSDVGVPTTVTCNAECSLSDQNRTDIANWVVSFKDWKVRHQNTNLRARGLITPLSFLIIAGLVFIFHWRFVRRDRKNMEVGSNLTRSAYFASMSFIWLITVVVVGGMLLNTSLRSVIPGAQTSRGGLVQPISETGTPMQSIVTCGEKCKLDAETISLAKEWKTENDAWTERQRSGSSSHDTQNALATELGFVIVALPLFLLHFRTWWKERQQSATPPPPIS